MSISNQQSPKGTSSPTQLGFVIEVRPVERWAIYHRLQELEIKCDCHTASPLKVEIPSPTAAVQLWSAARHIIAPRQQLVCWLEKCWHETTNIKE
jgi:hypothetical protein